MKWYAPRIRHLVADVRVFLDHSSEADTNSACSTKEKLGSEHKEQKTAYRTLKEQVRVVENPTREQFVKEICEQCEPVIIRGLDLGQAPKLWSFEYLERTALDKIVSVHVSPHSRMDFYDRFSLSFSLFLFLFLGDLLSGLTTPSLFRLVLQEFPIQDHVLKRTTPAV